MPIIGAVTRTMQDVVDEVRQRLQGSHTGARLDVLNGALTAGDTSVVLTDSVDGIRPGTVIELDAEQMYVRSVDTGTSTLTVLRGHNGTVATTHDDGDIVKIAPSYFLRDIFRAVQDEFSALNGTGLVQFQTVEFTYSNGVWQYDSGLPTTVDHLYVHKAEWESDVSYENWRPIKVTLEKNENTSDYASGSAFRIPEAPRRLRNASGRTVRVTVATSFQRPTDLTDEIDADALGTGDAVVPIVAIGAAWRLILGKEAQRLNPDWSHGSRRAEEVDGGSIAFLGRALESQRREMIEHALERQMALHPPRMEW